MEEVKEILIENSVLQSVRAALGLDPLDNSFDYELIMHINTAFATLNQNGVGSIIQIIDERATWDSFKDPSQMVGNTMFEMVKTYVSLKTKILFDPPPPSSVAYHIASVDELLWRLGVAYDLDRKGGE